MRLTELGDGGHDPARLRAGAAAEADLQLRSRHRRQQQARTAGGRPGGNRRKRPQGDRLQPVGRHAASGWPSGSSVSARWSITARCRQRRRDAVIERFRDDRGRHVLLMSYGAGGVGLEPPVRQLRVPLRPLVEPGRRGPGDQPRPSHRRRRPGQRHAISHARHDRGADRPHPAGEARAVRHRSSPAPRAAASSA